MFVNPSRTRQRFLAFISLAAAAVAPLTVSAQRIANANWQGVVRDSASGFPFRPRRLIFSPTPSDSFRVSFLSVQYYGRHRVRVYRVNEEYAQLYATLQQDSRDLNEPATNVHGGLGVFSAFSSDTTAVTVIKQP